MDTALLYGVLGITPTGDPAADAVYLLYLPMLTLYIFASFTMDTLAKGHRRLKPAFILMVYFYVIHEGLYRYFAMYSKALFVLALLIGLVPFFKERVLPKKKTRLEDEIDKMFEKKKL
ncbi:hypothetical protein GOV13_05185 [Candidatus Pacearchaeota archaeon]|nr:hypothetical protein [Candidatus Pacearchaeota archaeon]